MRIIRIPTHRVKALIGEHGKTKRNIEEKCNITLSIDSDGVVEINGKDEESEFFAEPVIKAIARGFSSKDALKLIDPEYILFIFDLNEYAKNKNGLIRLRARVIGTKGRIKTRIEQATDSIINVHGHTVGIIAKYDTIEYAKKAVDMILTGARHSTVENYLAKAEREIFNNRISGRG